MRLDAAYGAGGRIETVTQGTGEAARVMRYGYHDGPAPERWLPSSAQMPRAAEAEALPGQGVPVRFSWSAMLRPESVTDSGGATTSFDFDAEGNLLALTPPATPAHDASSAHGLPLIVHAGVVTSGYVHDDFGAATSASHQWPGDELTDQLTYDAAGRIASRTETDGDTTTVYAYSYDAAGRVHEVHVDGALRESYDYDANGNRIAAFAPASGLRPAYRFGPSLRRTQSAPQSGPAGALGLRPKSNAKLARSQALGRRSQGAAPGHQASGAQASGDVALDAQDRLLHYGHLDFTYNATGQLESRSDTVSGEHTAYHYDELGRLLAVTLPTGIEVSYLIDAAGRRVGRRVGGSGVTDTLVYLDALRPAASPSRGQLYLYTSGRNVPGLIVTAGATYRVVTDWRGSVRRVIDTDSGVVVQAVDYTAYGRVLRDTNPGFQPFGFAGGLTDPDTHLVHFGARDYDPETGRWTTKDPLLFAGGDTLLYAYTAGDPVNYIDPSGLPWWVNNPDTPIPILTEGCQSDVMQPGEMRNIDGFLQPPKRHFSGTRPSDFCNKTPDVGGGELYDDDKFSLVVRRDNDLLAQDVDFCRGCGWKDEQWASDNSLPHPYDQCTP